MSNRTQIVCLHEGKKGSSIDPVFINALFRSLDPAWLRPHGSNFIRLIPCDGRSSLISAMPGELERCLSQGGDTTLMVWADLDHDMANGDQLKAEFWEEAQGEGISEEEFSSVVFVFPKDRIENWVEFLLDGGTDESKEGARQKSNSRVADAARSLAGKCKVGADGAPEPNMPPSLAWSCKNWRSLVKRVKASY